MINTFIVIIWIFLGLLLLFIFYETLSPFFNKKNIDKEEKNLTKKERISYILNLGSFFIAVFAIQISLLAIRDSNEDRVEQENRYKEQRYKDSINQSISYASKDFLDSLNSSFDTLNNSFSNLNLNVNKISGKLENIPGQIDNISGSFQSLNETSQKQYSIIFEEYTQAQNQIKEQKEEKIRESLKRPYISIKGIECGEGYSPTYITIDNSGELIGLVTKIVFIIPDTVRSESFGIESVPSTTIKKDGFVVITSENLGEFKPRTPYRLKIGWQFFNPMPEGFNVKYKIFYYNKNTLDSTINSFKICNLTHN